jgi:hypothetical protein
VYIELYSVAIWGVGVSGLECRPKSGNKNTGNRSLENVSQFKYQNLIQEEIERRLNSGNSCYHSVQNLLSSRLLSKNVKVRRIYKTIILPVVLYGCETWSLTVREEHKLKVFENRSVENIWTKEGWSDGRVEKAA